MRPSSSKRDETSDTSDPLRWIGLRKRSFPLRSLWAIDSLRLSSSFSTFVVRLNRCLTSAELYRCLGNRSSALFISFPLSSSTPCARAGHLSAYLKSFSTFATERELLLLGLLSVLSLTPAKVPFSSSLFVASDTCRLPG